ncbi:MAG: hypothetical protein AAF502_05205 [Bacteroidota bacterium]
MKKLVLLALCFSFAFASYGQIINEFHYDNAGGDVGEFVEVYVAGPVFPANISDYEVVRYNGSNGSVYGTNTLGNNFGTDACNNRYYVIEYPANGLQNGSPDGLALVDDGGTLIQFISYEGSFMATAGPAVGAGMSTDVGVSETGGSPVGGSIEWTGVSWAINLGPDTRGAENANVDPGSACVPGAAVPTLGEWGLIILFLLILNIGTVFFIRRRNILAGQTA